LLNVVLALALSGMFHGLGAQAQEPGSRPIFFSGERLQYKVTWLFFRLGTIVVTTEKLAGTSAREEYRVIVSVESDPAIFFISVHNEYESIIDASTVTPTSFIAREFSGDDTLVTRYIMDDSLDQVHMFQWRDPGRTDVKEEVLDSINAFFEGTSMFFLARSLIHTDISVAVPTLVSLEFFETDITFTQKISGISIDALDEDVDTKELYGFAHFVESSIGGFSGEFRGWFSNDEAAIPILAEMNLALGTANIELEEWSRGSWSPPLLDERE
jgi:hypothetical protein